MNIAFVWHWQKKTLPELNGAFAAEDTLIKAIGRLSQEGMNIVIFTIGDRLRAFYSERQGIHYRLFPDKMALLSSLQDFKPDIVALNHDSKPYEDILSAIDFLEAKKLIFFATGITAHPVIRRFDAYFVHHEFQRQIVSANGYDPSKVVVAPKTADLEVFSIREGERKVWDCIYPSRGGFGYWKRLELAVEACRLSGKTLLIPGGNIPGTLNRAARPPGKLIRQRVPSALWGILEKWVGYPWVETLPWQLPEEMNVLYNKSRCLVITSNDKEMGPRVIPEAAACNLPIVCCSDSRACVSHAERVGGYIAEPNSRDVAVKIKQALSAPVRTRERLLSEGLDSWVIYDKLSELLRGWGL